MLEFETKVLRTIKEYSMFGENDIILTALSGGSDSVSLLHCLKERFGKTNKICAAHMNHGIRGENADRDENFCRELCKEWGIEFFFAKENIPEFAVQNKKSIEEAAREKRYAFLERTSKILGENVKIATAHNADDNAETVILNIVRGSGLNGLRGILPIRKNIIRPMLECTKDNVWEYIREKGLSYITDESNLSDEYTRNFIRHNVTENLYQKFPNARENITKMTKSLAADSDFIEIHVRETIEKFNITERINIDTLLSLHEAMKIRILQYMFAYAEGTLNGAKNRLEAKHLLIIFDEIKSRERSRNKSVDISRDIVFEISYGNASFRKRNNITKNTEFCIYPKKGENFISETGVKITTEAEKYDIFRKNIKSSENIYNLFNNALIDSDKIKGAIFIRNRRSGDSYIFNSQTKSVKKNYINLKIEKSLRERLPVLCDDLGIVWACGLPVADRVKPDSFTKEILTITANFSN